MSHWGPTSAGMYDYALGGTLHTAADRRAVAAARMILPELTDGLRANREFVLRAAARMASEWGVRQFVDLGAGLPTRLNTHDVVLGGRVVYVDDDPAVVEHGRRLLADQERVAVIRADIGDVERVLSHPETRRLIVAGEPVGLLAAAVLHFLPDDRDPWAVIARYLSAVPTGSYLAICALTSDQQDGGVVEKVRRALLGVRFHLRTRDEILRFFDGLEMVPPGLAHPHAENEGSHWFYAGVARKP